MSANASSRGFKLFLFLLLILFNSTTVLVGRFTRSSGDPSQRYDVAHFMIVTEILKLVLSLIAERFHSGTCTHIVQSLLSDFVRMTVPALLYLLQNSMIYYSLSYLSVPTFQVLYQSKLIMTAVLSSLCLHSKYNARQWVGLFLVTIGVTVVVTLSETRDESKGDRGTNKGRQLSDTSFGVILVFISCICSSLAGVYFEALIKNISPSACKSCVHHGMFCTSIFYRRESTTSSVESLWIRNIQLSVLTLFLALVQEIFVFLTSPNSSSEASDTPKSFLKGFTSWVYLQVWLLGGGGLVVAIVIKYTDNVQKGIATGLSVIVSSLLSKMIFGTVLNIYFTLGTIFVLLGLVLFNEDLLNYCFSFRWFQVMIYLIPTYILLVYWSLHHVSPPVHGLNKESPFLMSFSKEIINQMDGD